MKRLLALALLALVPGVARAAEIREYTTRLEVDAGGTGRAASTLVIAGGPSEAFDVPMSHRSFANVRVVEAAEGLRVEPPAAGGATFRVTLPPAAAATSRLSITFDVPEALDPPPDPAAAEKPTTPLESRTLRYAFVNTQAAPIKDFMFLVVLPEGSRFQAIREQLPKQRKSEAEPRVRLGGEGGRQSALLRLGGLRQGDATSMQLETVPNQRSLLWLVVGLVLSALYLVHFRDLVSPKPPPAETR
jgi:hypothetical protein